MSTCYQYDYNSESLSDSLLQQTTIVDDFTISNAISKIIVFMSLITGLFLICCGFGMFKNLCCKCRLLKLPKKYTKVIVISLGVLTSVGFIGSVVTFFLLYQNLDVVKTVAEGLKTNIINGCGQFAGISPALDALTYIASPTSTGTTNIKNLATYTSAFTDDVTTSPAPTYTYNNNAFSTSLVNDIVFASPVVTHPDASNYQNSQYAATSGKSTPSALTFADLIVHQIHYSNLAPDKEQVLIDYNNYISQGIYKDMLFVYSATSLGSIKDTALNNNDEDALNTISDPIHTLYGQALQSLQSVKTNINGNFPNLDTYWTYKPILAIVLFTPLIVLLILTVIQVVFRFKKIVLFTYFFELLFFVVIVVIYLMYSGTKDLSVFVTKVIYDGPERSKLFGTSAFIDNCVNNPLADLSTSLNLPNLKNSVSYPPTPPQNLEDIFINAENYCRYTTGPNPAVCANPATASNNVGVQHLLNPFYAFMNTNYNNAHTVALTKDNCHEIVNIILNVRDGIYFKITQSCMWSLVFSCVFFVSSLLFEFFYPDFLDKYRKYSAKVKSGVKSGVKTALKAKADTILKPEVKKVAEVKKDVKLDIKRDTSVKPKKQTP
jgi:hypothetical protein